MEKAILYRAGSQIGLGHLLVSISIYADYAAKTKRKFVLTIKNTTMSLDDSDAVDCFFTDIFDYTQSSYSNFDVSHAKFEDRIKAVFELGESCLLVGKNEHRNRLKGEFPQLFNGEVQFGDRQEYLGNIKSRQDFTHDVVVIDSICPAKKVSEVKGLVPFAPISPELVKQYSVYLPNKEYMGLHVRHGNGEMLHGRPEGGSDSFSRMVDDIANTAIDLKQEYNLDHVLVFSDNSKTVQNLCKLIDGVILNVDGLSTIPFQADLRAEQNLKKEKIIKIVRDFYLLSNAKVLCGGKSLFILAAGLWSSAVKCVQI